MKSKIIIFISGGLLSLAICLITSIILSKSSDIQNSYFLKNSNLISIMLQKDENSDEYEKSQASSWPKEGYIFNPYLSNCENGSELSWKNNRVMVSTKTSDKCYVYFDKYSFAKQCEYENIDSGACDIARTYSIDEALLYHNGTIADEAGNIIDANDKSYRYSGPSDKVNNYVCIDSKTEGSCDNDDLYRIIGLFKNDNEQYEIKLIKSDYATENQLGSDGAYAGIRTEYSDFYKGDKSNFSNIKRYYWNNITNNNNWKESNLNNINLNTNFLNWIKERQPGIEMKINNHQWKICGDEIDHPLIVPVKIYFDDEIKQCAQYSEKQIGLMYVSDYGYAVNSSAWNSNLYDYYQTSLTDNNWMYMGLWELTITPQNLADNDSSVNIIYYRGHVGGNRVDYNHCAVRPSFYLSSNTKFSSGGNGTIDTPYRIK